MENKFNFNSQVCTGRNQSERLLALGLKPETADCMIITKSNYVKHQPRVVFDYDGVLANTSGFEVIPAWSLHRLLSMLTAKRKVLLIRFEADLYDVLIDRIENEIKEGYFNKEYLI